MLWLYAASIVDGALLYRGPSSFETTIDNDEAEDFIWFLSEEDLIPDGWEKL